MTLSVRECGALGDGVATDTAALQRVIDRAAEHGGGTVVVPPGRYVTGALRLRSRVTLHLEAGAILLASENPADFPLGTSTWEGDGIRPYPAPLLGGEGLADIAVTGRGTIDGRGRRWWDRIRHGSADLDRPMVCRFIDCRNVRVEGVTFRHSPAWTLSPLACDNVSIHGVTIHNPPDSPNTDGINPDSCRNVRISDCHVDVGDDCITIKSGKEDDGRRELRPCENITVAGCTLVHGHGGVVIGSEVSGGVRNVLIGGCVFQDTDRGIRLKARRGRGGVVENVRVSNVVMDRVGAAVTMNLFYGCGAWDDPRVTDAAAHPVNDGTPRFRRIQLSQLTATGIRGAAVFVLGLPERAVEDVTIVDSAFYLDPGATEGFVPVMAPNIEPHRRSGLTLRDVLNLRLRNLDVYDADGPGLLLERGGQVTLAGIRFHGASTGPPTILDCPGLAATGVECQVFSDSEAAP